MALSKNTPVKEVLGEFTDLPLYRAIRAYEGAMMFLRADGYVTNAAGGLVFVGHADAEANNAAGGDGALSVRLRRGNYRLQVTLAGVAITDVSLPVYASDDGTLTKTSTANSLVGRIVRYVAANTCIVEFHAVGEGTVTVVEQSHIVNAKVDYTTGDLDAEAEVIAAVNTTNGKINSILTALEAAGVLSTS
jgi:hypothetical protein